MEVIEISSEEPNIKEENPSEEPEEENPSEEPEEEISSPEESEIKEEYSSE